jgi:hypothetical protein
LFYEYKDNRECISFILTQINFVKSELLSNDEVELASAVGPASPDRVETVGPVDTHQSNHGEEDTCTHAGRTLQIERIDLFQRVPRITCFQEPYGIYG